jgi:hypothetical protein
MKKQNNEELKINGWTILTDTEPENIYSAKIISLPILIANLPHTSGRLVTLNLFENIIRPRKKRKKMEVFNGRESAIFGGCDPK